MEYADEGERYLRLLHAMNIGQVEIVRMPDGGTEEVGEFLPEWSRQRQLSSVLVVTGTDHSRRVKRVLRRNSSGQQPRFTVRRSRYSAFTPERWWWRRSYRPNWGRRTSEARARRRSTPTVVVNCWLALTPDVDAGR